MYARRGMSEPTDLAGRAVRVDRADVAAAEIESDSRWPAARTRPSQHHQWHPVSASQRLPVADAAPLVRSLADGA